MGVWEEGRWPIPNRSTPVPDDSDLKATLGVNATAAEGQLVESRRAHRTTQKDAVEKATCASRSRANRDVESDGTIFFTFGLSHRPVT